MGISPDHESMRRFCCYASSALYFLLFLPARPRAIVIPTGRRHFIFVTCEGPAMDKELLFITVIGQDKKGIVARISGLLYDASVNIEDINQGIMEGFFVMTMAVDMRDANRDLETLSAQLQKLGDEMGMRIQIQHQNVFKMMHRI
jgi:ACT domain-containing protein